ncbi:glycoside hydrolase family 127 protein [Herbiconiux sp. VKM Ac-1786]|uniref:glycoside hydrolase family 127 protein n=1 Tax=Herbiconiux sp. VKM Ac-1786 TaxID=2783824 RepID=UPI00351BFEDC
MIMTLIDPAGRTIARSDRRAVVAPVVPASSALVPLGVGEVRLTGGFWAARQDVNAANTLPHIEHWLEREGWLANFDLAAAGTLPEGRRGREFSDSEVYKYLEALAWEIGRRPDAALETRFRAVVDRIAAAQEADGYLNTRFGRPGQEPRWSQLEWGHELYCAGHLFQAAVARARTAPGADDGLLGIATRVADLVCDVFGEQGIRSVCGHAEVETALVELGRVTGEPRYTEQARLFVERRGHQVLKDIEYGRSYFQDDIPVREADVMRGHAVRANYLASGAADVASELGDDELQQALRRQWLNTIARRTYVTGGQGSHHQDEGFGEDFELPSDRAYSETCAGIASIQFSWRMLLAEPDPAYADLIERTLYNVLATSPSEDGRAFYYANTLQQRVPGAVADVEEASLRASASLRAPWFEVSCCPPNIARTLASLDSYVATRDAHGVQLHQYAPAVIRTRLEDGEEIALTVQTEYPATGRVTVTIDADASRTWTLSLRVPAWAEGAELSIDPADGTTDREQRTVPPGTAEVTRAFRAGDTITLQLPMAPRFVHPDPRIDGVRGSVAVARGPEVLALESVDLPAGIDDVADVALDASIAPVVRDGEVLVTLRPRRVPEAPFPYTPAPGAELGDPVAVRLVPYHDWAERGPSTMRIWLPTT